MNTVLSDDPSKVTEYRERFVDTMAFVKRVFPLGFRRAKGGTATPRARFEAIAIGSFGALQSRPELSQQPVDVSPWIDGVKFGKLTGSDGANAVSRLKGRISYVKKRLTEV